MSTFPVFYPAAAPASPRMDPETLNALNGSINKWSNIVAGTGADKLSRNCALCKMFMDKNRCVGCPVAAKAGVGGCHQTPFEEWNEHQALVHMPESILKRVVHKGCVECARLAQAELDFLRSLLPATEQGAKR